MQAHQAKLSPLITRFALRIWAFFARHVKLYQWLAAVNIRLLGRFGQNKGRFRYLPFLGAWTASRDLPAPQGKTFMAMWKQRQVK